MYQNPAQIIERWDAVKKFGDRALCLDCTHRVEILGRVTCGLDLSIPECKRKGKFTRER